MSRKTDFTKQKKPQDEDGSYMVSIGKKPLCRMYHEKNHFTRKRRRKLSKWQFLTKKAKELKNRMTAAEVVFERKLQELGYKYISQKAFLYHEIGGIADFYIPSMRVYIEIDGGYHLETDQIQTDLIKDFVYHRLQAGVLRMTNNQAMFLSIEQINTLIKSKKCRKHR